jgi:hypothetical protein
VAAARLISPLIPLLLKIRYAYTHVLARQTLALRDTCRGNKRRRRERDTIQVVCVCVDNGFFATGLIMFTYQLGEGI